MTGLKRARVAGGLAVAGRQLRSRPSGRQPYGRGGCRVLLSRHRPPPVPAVMSPMRRGASRSRPSCVAPDTPIAARRSQPPGRNAAHCPARPLHPQGHPKILSNRSAESIFGTHPCARSLCRPGGPDGEGQAEGQARNVRGKPPQPSTWMPCAGAR